MEKPNEIWGRALCFKAPDGPRDFAVRVIRSQRYLGAIYAFVILLIAIGCFTAWRAEKSALKAEMWVAHTLAVREQLTEMLTLCTRVESSCWDFLLTGQMTALADVEIERRAIAADLGQLQNLTRDNPIQQHSLRQLEKLEVAQTAFQQRLVEVAKLEGEDTAREAAHAGGGSRLAEIRSLIDRMIAEETKLLPGRQEEVVVQDRKIVWLFASLAALSVIFLAFSNFRIHRMLHEAKNREAGLARSNADLVETQRMAKVGSWVWEIEPDVVTWSKELYHIFRLPEGSAPPTYAKQRLLYTPESAAELAGAVETSLATGAPYALELDGLHPDGAKFVVWVTGRAERDETGTITRLFGTAQDVTGAREALERERALTQKAQLALEAKGQFLAVMSHEIRTPINGILGFADQLAECPLLPAQQECVKVIQQSGQSLLRIINDILDFSWMQSGRLKITEAPFSPRLLIESVHVQLAARLGQPGVAFATDICAGLPDRLIGDGERLRQILNNLGENALKFTAEGAVTMGVRDLPAAHVGDVMQFEFFVRDSGIGIAPEKIGEIFEPFTQAEGTIRRRFGGTGLGLSIALQLVRTMGGNMTVHSTPGVGSEFSFSLPLKIVPDETPEEKAPAAETLDADFARRHPLSILVAEDDRTNSRVILYLLRKLGYEAGHAWNGLEALERSRTPYRPECILMDIHMPDLDGFGATRAIRSDEEKNGLAPIHIIALTADILPKAQRDCRDAGMSDYLSKPVSLRTLSEALLRCS